MSEQLRMEREDWLSRFFGFLGAFHYKRSKKVIAYPFSLYDKEITEDITGEERKNGKIVDNIVYIYGVPSSGKSMYRGMLYDELASDYSCITIDFEKYSQGLSRDDFTKILSAHMEEKLKFEFPCTKLSYGEEMAGGSVYAELLWDSAKSLFGIAAGSIPEKVDSVRSLIDDAKKAMALRSQSISKSELAMYQEMKKELSEAAKSGKHIDLSASKDNPYNYLKIDLNGNLKRHMAKKNGKRIICFIDTFERYGAVTGTDSATLVEYNPFLEMMASVPDVVWVIFGSKRPSDAVRKYVPAENCWCMKGARKESVIKYLKGKCPDASENWVNQVYKRSAGYIPLLTYCIKELKVHPEGANVDWNAIKQTAAMLNMSVERLMELGGGNVKNPKDIELWFDCLWEANWSAWDGEEYISIEKMNDEEKEKYLTCDVLSKVFETEYAHAVTDSDDPIRMFLPTLAYLVQRSSENVGTIQQFSWRRKGKFAELNARGQSCVNAIGATTPFCLEFLEYPEYLYLDPVIIEIMQSNSHYREWYDYFVDTCFLKRDEMSTNDGSLEAAERAKNSVQAMVTTKRKLNKVSADIGADERVMVDGSRFDGIDSEEKTDVPTIAEEKQEDYETTEREGTTPEEQSVEAIKHLHESDKVDETGVDKSKSQGKSILQETNPYVFTLADDVWKDIVWGDKVLPNNPGDK